MKKRHETKLKWLQIRITELDKSRINRLSKLSGLSMSMYVIKKALDLPVELRYKRLPSALK